MSIRQPKLKIVLADLFYINRLTKSRLCVPLNVGYIAAYIQKLFGNAVEILIYKDVNLLLDYLNYNKPDIVGFSFYYWNQNLNYHVVKKIREAYGNDVVTVFGGPSVDSIEEEHKKLLLKFPLVDIFIEGEGEAGFSDLVAKMLSCSESIYNSPIDCSFFSKDGEYIKGLNTSVNLDLSDVPSPYLTGFMDEFLQESYIPLIQATRTCPYQCTFCVAGREGSKLRAFPLDQVKQEIDYIASWYKGKPHITLNLAELNFGINKQDPDIARYLKSVSDKTGYPRSVYFYSDKRFSDRSKAVIEALGNMNRDGLVFSLQSDHPETLKTIKRKNLSEDDINDGIAWAKEHQIPVTTEIIFGLPHETYSSMVDLLNKSVQQGFDSIMLHNLFVMEGVELNRETERIKHEMKSQFRLLGSNYMMIGEEFIFEYEQVVTESKYFSFEEFIKIRCLNLMFFSVFQGGFYKFFFQYVKGNGIQLVSLFDTFMNPDPNEQWPEEYLKFVNDFKRDSIAELYNDLDTLEENTYRVYKINNDVGEPVRLNPFYFSKLMYTGQTWCKKVLKHILHSQLLDNFNELEVSNILEASERSIINLRNLDITPTNLNIDYDLVSWKNDKFHSNIDKYKVKNGCLEFSLTKLQHEKLLSFADVSKNLSDADYFFVAVESILPRLDLFYSLSFNGNRTV